jgi:hypothetical protein
LIGHEVAVGIGVVFRARDAEGMEKEDEGVAGGVGAELR